MTELDLSMTDLVHCDHATLKSTSVFRWRQDRRLPWAAGPSSWKGSLSACHSTICPIRHSTHPRPPCFGRGARNGGSRDSWGKRMWARASANFGVHHIPSFVFAASPPVAYRGMTQASSGDTPWQKGIWKKPPIRVGARESLQPRAMVPARARGCVCRSCRDPRHMRFRCMSASFAPAIRHRVWRHVLRPVTRWYRAYRQTSARDGFRRSSAPLLRRICRLPRIEYCPEGKVMQFDGRV
jgi:hypothetical protein